MKKGLLTGFVFGILLFMMYRCAYCDTLNMVARYSEKWGVDRRLVNSMIMAESSGKKGVISHKGAYGEMQVTRIACIQYFQMRYEATGNKKYIAYQKMPESFFKAYLSITSYNLNVGCFYLRWCLDRAGGNYTKALQYYIHGSLEPVAWEYINDIIDGCIGFKK